MPDRDEIYQKVSETLQEALGVDEDEVSPEATLMGDLGAESIDFLDITFQLEKQFDLKISRPELFPGVADMGDIENLVADGKLTDAGLAELRKRLPHANVDDLEADPRQENVQNLYTVDMIVNYIESRLNK